MAPKAKNVRKGDEDEQKVLPSKEQDEIAKFLRFNCQTNMTIYQENEAHYFSGNKAVDTLLNSKYGNKAKGEAKFADRNACTHYIQELMDLGMFFRAKKLVSKKNKEKKKDKKDSDMSASEQDDKKEDEKEEGKKTAEAEKKKKKVKLEWHPTQTFLDDKDVYVWIFDPTPLWKKLVGLGMVLVTVAGCCFPLWPMWMRQGVWYLSMAGLGAFGAILVTAILRTILFGIIWLVTGGQHKLWVLPNLTEDCGFFESFKPWYTYEYCPRGGSQSAEEDESKKKTDKKKKDKDSDVEEEEAPKKDEKGDAVEDSAGSQSEEDEQNSTGGSASDSEPSALPTPESSTQPRKRRARREDDGFVHVN